MRAFILTFVAYLTFGLIAQAHAFEQPMQPKGLRPPAIKEVVCTPEPDQCCLLTERGRFCAAPQVLPYFIRTSQEVTEGMCEGPLCRRNGRIVGLSPFYTFY